MSSQALPAADPTPGPALPIRYSTLYPPASPLGTIPTYLVPTIPDANSWTNVFQQYQHQFHAPMNNLPPPKSPSDASQTSSSTLSPSNTSSPISGIANGYSQELQNAIANYESTRQQNRLKLKTLGISSPGQPLRHLVCENRAMRRRGSSSPRGIRSCNFLQALQPSPPSIPLPPVRCR